MFTRALIIFFLSAAALLLVASGRAFAAEPRVEWRRIQELSAGDFISNEITGLARDLSNRLWVGTNRGLVWSSDRGRSWNVVNLSQAAPREAVRRNVWELPSNAVANLTQAQAFQRNTITCVTAGRSGIWIGTRNGLCYGSDDLNIWEVYSEEMEGPGPEIFAITEYLGEIWVSATNGVFRSVTPGVPWEKININYPGHVTTIAIGHGPRGKTIWLGGFQSEPAYGGGNDLLRSEDDGGSWQAFRTGTASIAHRITTTKINRLVFNGITLWAATDFGVARSLDGGEDWHKTKPGSGFDAEKAYDFAFLPGEVWVATNEGIYVSYDKGESWSHDGNLRCPVRHLQSFGRELWMGTYGGIINRMSGGTLYVQSMKADVLSLLREEKRPGFLWVGTAGGLVLSRDNGQSWRTLTVADGLPSNTIRKLATDGVYIWGATDGGVFRLSGEGNNILTFFRENGLKSLNINSLDIIHVSDADGKTQTKVLAATDRGLSILAAGSRAWRTYQFKWRWLCAAVHENTIFGAVTDADNGEGIQVVSGTIQPEQWQTIFVPGHNGGAVHQFLVTGDSIWMAADSGLFKSRNLGQTWSRYGTDTLWSSRVTRMRLVAPNMIGVQAVPNDPPSTVTYFNVTRDGGKSWSVLPNAIPGEAADFIVADGKLLAAIPVRQFGESYLAGTLAEYPDFEKSLSPAGQGWLMWNRLASYASSTFREDRLGYVSNVLNGFHGPYLVIGSAGSGAVERGIPATDPIFSSWSVSGQVPLQIEPFAMLQGETITAIAENSFGAWFGTAKALHLRTYSGTWHTFFPGSEGLPSAPVLALLVINDEVWVGTDKGISILNCRDNKWRTVAHQLLDGKPVKTLAFDGSNVWGGTDSGGFVIRPDGSVSSLLENEDIRDIAIGVEREYFASGWGVMVRDREGEARRHLQAPLLPDNDVKKLFLDGTSLWVATAQGVVRTPLFDSSEPTAYSQPPASDRGPAGVLVVVNELSDDSKAIAEAYGKLRNIPAENFCYIRVPIAETIPRETFNVLILNPIRRHLLEKGIAGRITYIVTTSGVPLRVSSMAPGESPEDRTEACVDSELTLLGLRHPVSGGIPNPYLHRDELFNSGKFKFYLVTRLDGPNARRTILNVQNAMDVEENRIYGSTGFARFDLDDSQQEAIKLVNKAIMSNFYLMRRQERWHGRIEPPEYSSLPFYRPGAASNTFFFLGIGEGDYKPDVFSWVRGAIGVSLDPVTAQSLKSGGSWVAGAVDRGLCATIGQISDPGSNGALSVAELYRHIMAGYTWAEAAYMCIPQLSWQTVVIGDPLYSPYD